MLYEITINATELTAEAITSAAKNNFMFELHTVIISVGIGKAKVKKVIYKVKVVVVKSDTLNVPTFWHYMLCFVRICWLISSEYNFTEGNGNIFVGILTDILIV